MWGSKWLRHGSGSEYWASPCPSPFNGRKQSAAPFLSERELSFSFFHYSINNSHMHVCDFCISDIWVVVNFSVMDSIVIDGKPRIHHTAVSVKPVEQEFFFQINRFYHFTSDLQPCNQLVLWGKTAKKWLWYFCLKICCHTLAIFQSDFKIVVFKFWNWSVCNAVRKYFSMVLRVVVSGDTNRGAEGSATVDRHTGTLAIAAAPAHVPWCQRAWNQFQQNWTRLTYSLSQQLSVAKW